MTIIRCQLERWSQRLAAGIGSSATGIFLAGMLAGGCAHSEKHSTDLLPASIGGIPAPEVPMFLNGPLALLLTNAEGFRARVALEGVTDASVNGAIAGELMSRGGKLFFAQEPNPAGGKKARAEDFSYIWDVSTGQGYMLNGPLQGYAPISSKNRYTNMVVEAGKSAAAERMAGHPCQQSEVTVTSSEGVATQFHLWRATDLKEVPVRVTFTSDGKPVTLSLSKLRLEVPPQELFLPPDGFTKYASAEGMVNELASREQNLKRKRGYEPPISDDIGFRDGHAPTRTQ